MAKKLRIRFVLVSMLSLLAVLTVIMLTINLSNYAEVQRDADAVLAELQAGGGQFRGMDGAAPPTLPDGTTPQEGTNPPALPDGEQPSGEHQPNEWRGMAKNGRFNAETPFETRYFTVTVNEDGTYTADTDNIAAVDAQTSIQMAQEVLTKGRTKGYNGIYRYLVADGGNMVLFVDCSRGLDNAKTFLHTSLIVSAAAILGMFVLVFLFSKRAVKPTVEAYQRQRQFVTEASHELKTPITIISANNELLQLEYGENESTEAIEEQVKRLSSMVKNLVSLSRLDEVETLAEKVPCDLSECLVEQVELCQGALCRNERTLDVDIHENVVVEGREDMLGQLVGILLENAIKYAATFTTIRLTRDKNVVLTIANDATGLSDGDKSRCFERFYRDADVSAGIEGSGIGLAIAKQIVALHHGTISAHAKDGVFTIKVTL